MSDIDPRVAEAAILEARALNVDVRLDYEEFLAETGRDDSFVGHPEGGVPSTHDVYLASQWLLDAEPSPSTSM